MKNRIIIFSITLLLLCSCSFIKTDNKTSPIEHPDLILINSTYKVNLSNSVNIEFSADKIEFHNKKNLTYLENVVFNVFDQNDIIANGSCEKIEANTKNNNLLLSGEVKINLLNPKFIIKCDNINWNNKTKVLNTDSDVNIESEMGLFYGIGFSANLDTRYFEFKELKNGEIYEKNN